MASENDDSTEPAYMVDVTNPDVVEIVVRPDGKVLWVNVDGICRFRACQIRDHVLYIDDQRDDAGLNSLLKKDG